MVKPTAMLGAMSRGLHLLEIGAMAMAKVKKIWSRYK
jgi:hypothetical protein